ncbi:opacity protein-like surface antigen [Paucibacter oligotrophus]|uniref:Opacity protein-like surface antigen n=1 Tax=Roseateles oligotrophus TaxID=1769250 RepID=A0A840L208_9BURK|nr:outer membrane beta-barrel protein [Roseateles oligotrophus]MBB4841936.1 opacity protein-like surface antigen [Roseateles oligotrophus]
MPKVIKAIQSHQGLSAIALTGLALAIGAALPTQAHAQSKNQETPYIGANIGLYNKYAMDCKGGVACDLTARAGGKVFIGQQFEYLGGLGLEAMAYGISSGQGTVKRGSGEEAGWVKQAGLGVYAVLPLSYGDFSFKGKLGAGYAQGKASYAAGGSDSKWSFQGIYGLGVSYAINKQISLNLDYDNVGAKYGAGSTRVGMFSTGLSYRF